MCLFHEQCASIHVCVIERKQRERQGERDTQRSESEEVVCVGMCSLCFGVNERCNGSKKKEQ